MKHKQIFSLVLIPILASIIFTLEQLLSFLPNIQLTVFLIVLFAKKLGTLKAIIIILIHTLLDNILLGGFNFWYFSFMFIGWCFIPLIIKLFGPKLNSSLALAFIGVVASFFYSWSFAIGNAIVLKINLIDYLKADFLFEVILAISSFISIFWLYDPLSKLFDQIISNK